MKINKKFLHLVKKLNNSGNKTIYGYRTYSGDIIVYNKKDSKFYFIEDKEVTSNEEKIENYVKNIGAIFKKFSHINFVILEKTSDKKIDKETALKVNKKILEYIKNNLEHGKLLIEETGTTLYYSTKLQELKI